MIGWVIILAVWITYIEVEHPYRMNEQAEETSNE